MKNSILLFSEKTGKKEKYDSLEICEDVVVKKETFQVEHAYYRCNADESIICTPEQHAINRKRDNDAYRQKHQLLSSEELRDIRAKYLLTQRNLSKITGIAQKTLSSIENGEIQTDYVDTIFRLIDDPYALLKLIVQKPNMLSKERLYNLKLRLRQVIIEADEHNKRIGSILKIDWI